MTTATFQPGRRNPLPLIIMTGVVLFIGGAILMAASHADLKHGREVQDTRDCVQRNGTLQIWREPNKGPFHLLCLDPITGTIYDWIRNPDGSERTAFSPNPFKLGNTINNISNWLRAKGATLFKGQLPFDMLKWR